MSGQENYIENSLDKSSRTYPAGPGSGHQDPAASGHARVNHGAPGFSRVNPDDETPDEYKNDLMINLKDASQLFREGGVPRNPRTLRRYCENKKTGLYCDFVEGAHGMQYVVSKLSTEEYITKLQQTLKVSNGHVADHLDGQSGADPDLSTIDLEQELKIARENQEEAEARAVKAEELADEYRINDAANKIVIREYKNQFKEIRNEMRYSERQIVILEHVVHKHEALNAPTKIHDAAEVKEVASENAFYSENNSDQNMNDHQPGV